MNCKCDAGYIGGSHNRVRGARSLAHVVCLVICSYIFLVPKTSCANWMYRGRIETTEMCLPGGAFAHCKCFTFIIRFDYYSQLLNGLDAIEVKAFMFFWFAQRKRFLTFCARRLQPMARIDICFFSIPLWRENGNEAFKCFDCIQMGAKTRICQQITASFCCWLSNSIWMSWLTSSGSGPKW